VITVNLEQIALAEAEHAAWLDTVAELRKASGTTWNDPEWKPLHRAVLVWGERLAALRAEQTVDIRARALAEAEAK
jgi:hypothetical protein